MENKWTQVATISKTYERAVAENLGISKNLIRELSLSGKIPVVHVGNRTKLIPWNGLINFLENGSSKQDHIEQPVIRKINV